MHPLEPLAGVGFKSTELELALVRCRQLKLVRVRWMRETMNLLTTSDGACWRELNARTALGCVCGKPSEAVTPPASRKKELISPSASQALSQLRDQAPIRYPGAR